ncbi:MAG: nucleotide-binding universal stress UspA family protein [Candidatus Nanohaloarchaea archaeon]|jgi:nucleotide-binding universal stress UspA family protein
MYEKILLPTDGSDESMQAVNHAEELADKFGAEVHILHVADISKEAGEPRIPSQVEAMRDVGEEMVNEVEEKFSEEVKTTTEVKVGIPHKEINSYVEEKDIDLITMGSHGRSGLNRMLLGSVTEKVLRTCSVPVLTIQSEE